MISSVQEILIHTVLSRCMFVSKVSQWITAQSKSYSCTVCFYAEKCIGICKIISDGVCFEAYVEEVAKAKRCIVWSFSSFMVECWVLKTSYSNIIRYILQSG